MTKSPTNAIDQLRDRDTVEAAIIVARYDEMPDCPDRLVLKALAQEIVERLAQDEEPEENDIPF